MLIAEDFDQTTKSAVDQWNHFEVHGRGPLALTQICSGPSHTVRVSERELHLSSSTLQSDYLIGSFYSFNWAEWSSWYIWRAGDQERGEPD